MTIVHLAAVMAADVILSGIVAFVLIIAALWVWEVFTHR